MTDVPDLDRFHREAVEEGRQQTIANRWEAFSPDELADLIDGLNRVLSSRVSMNADDMALDIRAELERRKA